MLALLSDPAAWLALVTLIVMEVVLGIDNLIFISVLTNRLPEPQRRPARRLGISLALIMRLVLLSTIAWIASLTQPILTLPLQPPMNGDGHPAFDPALSWRDLILLAGGLFLVWKATSEIHHAVDPWAHEERGSDVTGKVAMTIGGAVVQILVLDIVFSIDSIVTAVGMTDEIGIMFIAVIVAVLVMLLAAEPLSRYIAANPTIVMLALGFLLMIGMTLIAYGFGFHVPKGYIYAAMGFSALVEALNMLARRSKAKRKTAPAASMPPPPGERAELRRE